MTRDAAFLKGLIRECEAILVRLRELRHMADHTDIDSQKLKLNERIEALEADLVKLRGELAGVESETI